MPSNVQSYETLSIPFIEDKDATIKADATI